MASQAEWERRFRTWAQGPSASETARGDNARRIISDCMRDAGILDKYELDIFPQGSFPNRTNIPQESDVDISVRCMAAFYPEYPAGYGKEHFRNIDSSVRYADLKDDVGRALNKRFASDSVRGNKCFTIRSNTYRIDADVTPSLEHRRYTDVNNPGSYHSGCEFFSDTGQRIINWPRQHIENGIVKNDATRRRFKRLTRVLKRLQFALIEEGALQQKLVPSYAIECAVFNIPNGKFLDEPYWTSVRRVLAFIFNDTLKDESCSEWVEVNHLKWMFRGAKPWTRTDVHRLASLGWNHIGFE